MHKYERFIIYPLLIVVLFYGFAGEQMTTTAQEVMDKLVVREISVVNDDDEEVVNIASTVLNDSGKIDIRSPESGTYSTIYYYGYSVLHSTGLRSTLGSYRLTFAERDPDSKIAAMGVSNDLRGFVHTYNEYGDDLVSIGDTEEEHGGIWVYNKNGKQPQFYGHRRY